jgi:hypothetical protein
LLKKGQFLSQIIPFYPIKYPDQGIDEVTSAPYLSGQNVEYTYAMEYLSFMFSFRADLLCVILWGERTAS